MLQRKCKQIRVDYLSKLITMSLQSDYEFSQSHRKIDLYELLTGDELEQVTNIFLEALAREKNISPEVFEIETNILVESVLEVN